MNFFKIANKEIDQDNFIHWLLECFDSNNSLEKEACFSLIRLFTKENLEGGLIENVCVRTQVDLKASGRIDLLCAIKTSCFIYLLAIEDKIDAAVNNDLKAYFEYISKNKEKLLKRFGYSSENAIDLKTLFIVFKTGNYLRSSDNERIKNSPFILIDRKAVVNCLCSYKEHYLIGSFLDNLSYSDSIMLTSFQCKKDYLCECLSVDLRNSIRFSDSKYTITFQNAEYWLEITNFPLTKPEFIIYILSEKKKKIVSTYYEGIHKSKLHKLGKKKIKLSNSTYIELSKVLDEAIKEVEKLFEGA